MHAGAALPPHVSPPYLLEQAPVTSDVAARHGTGGGVFQRRRVPAFLLGAADARFVFPPHSAASMSDHGGGDQRQKCRRGVMGVDVVELDAAMALAGMAGVGPAARPAPQPQRGETGEEEEELASTRLSLELGKVGIQSSSCSSTGWRPAADPGYGGPRPRHALNEAEKEAKRLRRVLANRESARKTILRRQAIRDELARKVADLSSQNESMKKEKETVMQEYLALMETNKQLKEQVVAMTTTRKASALASATVERDAAAAAEAATSTASQPGAAPQQSFMYAAAAPSAGPVPYVWGSWAPGYEQGHRPAPAGAGPLGLRPCAWYHPVAADARGSPSASCAQPTSGTAEGEDTDDDPCSLTLGLDVVDRRTAPGAASGRATATAAEARKRRKELTKLKQMHGGGRPEDE